jgi:hypothetical protein
VDFPFRQSLVRLLACTFHRKVDGRFILGLVRVATPNGRGVTLEQRFVDSESAKLKLLAGSNTIQKE